MTKFTLIAIAASMFSLAACSEKQDPNPIVVDEPDTPKNVRDDINECPRADGNPCY